jgi:selenocysteine-specific elongation factor
VPADATAEVRRRTTVDAAWLSASGLPGEPDALRIGSRWVDAERWEQWRHALRDLMAGAPGGGVAAGVIQEQLGVPDQELLMSLVATDSTIRIEAGLVRRADARIDLTAITDLLDRLAVDPFAAPDGEEVRRTDRAALAGGVRAGRIVQVGPAVYLAAEAPQRAVELLSALAQPFTVSAAAGALGASRRVVVPLLEHLDATRKTRRLPDGTRVLVAATG